MSIPSAPKKYTDSFRSMPEWWTYEKNWEDGMELVVLTPEDKVLVFPFKCREHDMLYHSELIAEEMPSPVGTTIMANLSMYEGTRLLTA